MRATINDYSAKEREHADAVAALERAKAYIAKIKEKRKIHRITVNKRIIECSDGFREAYDENVANVTPISKQMDATKTRNKEIVKLHEEGKSIKEIKEILHLTLKDDTITNIIRVRTRWM